MFIQSCKEDTTPPTITLIGSPDTIIAKNSIYIDPGATADDNKDDAVYVISDYSPSNPDETVTMPYTITYKAQDRNANMATATRTVNVTWTGSSLAYNYAVVDTSQMDTIAYASTVTPDILNTFRVYIGNLMNGTLFVSSTYADLKANSVTIPTQRPDGLFSPYIVSGSGTIADVPPNIIWDIHYTVQDTTGTLPTLHRHAVLVY